MAPGPFELLSIAGIGLLLLLLPLLGIAWLMWVVAGSGRGDRDDSGE